jgi:hypothetical protein
VTNTLAYFPERLKNTKKIKTMLLKLLKQITDNPMLYKFCYQLFMPVRHAWENKTAFFSTLGHPLSGYRRA